MKEIIIDDINVAECGFYHPEIDNCCHIAFAFAEIYIDDNHNYLECNKNPNCYFKQLQRLKQENETLKDTLKIWQYSDTQHLIEINKYKQALEEIRKIIKTLIIEMPEYHDCYYKDECGDNCTPKQQSKVAYCCFENVEKIEKLINKVLK